MARSSPCARTRVRQGTHTFAHPRDELIGVPYARGQQRAVMLPTCRLLDNRAPQRLEDFFAIRSLSTHLHGGTQYCQLETRAPVTAVEEGALDVALKHEPAWQRRRDSWWQWRAMPALRFADLSPVFALEIGGGVPRLGAVRPP